jgi:hypothetical protein
MTETKVFHMSAKAIDCSCLSATGYFGTPHQPPARWLYTTRCVMQWQQLKTACMLSTCKWYTSTTPDERTSRLMLHDVNCENVIGKISTCATLSSQISGQALLATHQTGQTFLFLVKLNHALSKRPTPCSRSKQPASCATGALLDAVWPTAAIW